jgi:tetratricopeptide (TPR) repeat protein
VYDPVKGLGALVFEDEEDARKGALKRKAKLVSADDIGATLRHHRVPLFVLEACQTAKTEDQPHASVAAALLRAGVASVVAMSHSVLVSTAQRFFEAFYGGLVEGQRIGTAMASAQRALKLNRTRHERDDGSRLELDDWLVPVLFQEGDADPQLVPGGADLSPQAKDARRRKSEQAQGKLPPPPAHSFVGRGRELLAIDRMLLRAPEGGRLLALVGPGGLGKTALALEAARWLLAIRRVQRVAFASVEQVSDARGVIATLGEQLVPGYTIATAESEGRETEKLHNALLPIEQALWSTPALIVIDNLESVLPVSGAEPSDDVKALFGALVRLAKAGETRVVLTSRESVPEAVTAGLRVATLELRLGALGRVEAVELLGAVLRQKGRVPAGEAAKEQVEALVDAVGGHARSLVLLGGEVAVRGVAKTTDEVRELMRALEKRHPGKTDEEKRELSLIASAKLSLRRLPEAVQRQIRPLAVFHGAAHYEVIAMVLEMEPAAVLDLCRQLVAVGLAGADGLYVLPDPALGVALAEDLSTEERTPAEGRWLEAVEAFVRFLDQQQFKDAHVAAQGTRTMLADLLAVLETRVAQVEAGGRDAAAAIEFVTQLESLVSSLGLPRVLRRVSAVRQALTVRLPAWGHERFVAEAHEVDRQLGAGDLPGALKAALALREKAEAAGDVYPQAAYDRTMAWLRLGHVLGRGGAAEQAMRVLREAEKRFGALAAAGDESAAGMQATSLTEQGTALVQLGRLGEATAAYEKAIKQAEAVGDLRNAAVGRSKLASVWISQGKLGDALTTYVQARKIFEKLGEPDTVAEYWHRIGTVHQKAKQIDAAEAAYRSALALWVAQGDQAGESLTLAQLGSLYNDQGRLDEAATYYRQAAELFRVLGDKYNAGMVWSDLSITLHKLRRFDEAREALEAALALKKDFGHAANPWYTWVVLADVERDAGKPDAAAEARHQAMTTYRAYRTDGGEPMDAATRLTAAFGKALRTQGPEAARALFVDGQFAPGMEPLQRALEALAAGQRDPALAADPALDPIRALELTLVLEALAVPT